MWREAPSDIRADEMKGDWKTEVRTKLRSIWSLLVPVITTNIKHILAPSQIKINSHTEGRLNSVPITWYNLCSLQQKIYKASQKSRCIQSDEKKQSSKLSSDMIQMLRLLARECQITKVTVVRSPVEKLMPAKEMGTESRHVGILRKNQKDLLKMKTTERRIKNASEGLVSRCNNTT